MRLIALLSIVLVHACFAEETSVVLATTKLTHIPEWHTDLVEEVYCLPESDNCSTELYSSDSQINKKRLLAKGLTGPFALLIKSQKIISCEDNSVMMKHNPLLIELDGKVTPINTHEGYLKTCKIVGTGEEVLLVYSQLESGKPINFIRVVDSRGKSLVEKRMESEGDVEYFVKGIKYQVSVEAPEWPG